MNLGTGLSELIRLLSKIARRIRHSCRSLIGIPRNYSFEDCEIALPASHALWLYQAEHPRYDRFLPHLARFIKADQSIIDIGANVGDSLAGMSAANSDPTYVCIEADEFFYQRLLDNIDRIKKTKPSLKVHPAKRLVGKSVIASGLEGRSGTKRAVASDKGSIISQPLDQIVAEFPGLPAARLLKTDVDGFDYDVIESSLSLIERMKPLIFFECDCASDEQRSGFDRIVRVLESFGYNDWAIFDNFGQLMLRTSDIESLLQLMRYAWRQSSEPSTRTIYYVDVLVSHSNDRLLIDQVLSTY
jgi:FkbM family methyltransferase